ncbi:MAG TPA: hypothetical protein VH500_23975, partial [Nitrososphaeraceae archaeon]
SKSIESFSFLFHKDSSMASILNHNRMLCKACLSAGRLSINDTDDREGTTQYGIRGAPHDKKYT